MPTVQSQSFRDANDIPFMLPAERIISLDLPKPPSTNSLWRHNAAGKAHGKIYLSPKYQAWKKEADMAVMVAGSLRGFKTIPGKFEIRIVIQRSVGDLDNRIKAVLDWAQSRAIVANDKHCERVTAEWGEAPKGCRVIVREIGLGVSCETTGAA